MKLFRREWIFPALIVAFVAASADASPRDELSAQAAGDLHCNSVSIIPSSETQFLATGCGQDCTYTCDEEGTCTLDDDGSTHAGAGGGGHDPADDAAAEAIAESIMELGCACASAAMTSHHSHSHATTHKRK